MGKYYIITTLWALHGRDKNKLIFSLVRYCFLYVIMSNLREFQMLLLLVFGCFSSLVPYCSLLYCGVSLSDSDPSVLVRRGVGMESRL